MTDQPLPEHVYINRAHWDQDAASWVASGARQWRSEPRWGMWGIPIPGLLPDDMTGLDAIELGCGTAYVSAWMARRGAKVIGIDNAGSDCSGKPGSRSWISWNSRHRSPLPTRRETCTIS